MNGENTELTVLVVKVSSLGDIIHTLPAITDARRANRHVRFDWVVEENFVEIPDWHPAVDKVIPVAIRRWRTELFKSLANYRQVKREVRAFKKELRNEHYDLIIDAQGLIKSGIICRMAKGITVGLSNSTIKEPLATLFYNKAFSVPKTDHAVERVRELFSRALNYSINLPVADYGLDPKRIGLFRPEGEQEDEQPRGETARSATTGRPTLIFLHGTTWATKHWPEQYWRQLAGLAVSAGYSVELAWATEAELERARRIAEGFDQVRVLDRQNLSGMARHIYRASGVVAVDTGLGHLAAALEVPVLSLYGPTNPGLSGTFGKHQARLRSGFGCAPCLSKKCVYNGETVTAAFEGQAFSVTPPCFSSHEPAEVFQELQRLISHKQNEPDEIDVMRL